MLVNLGRKELACLHRLILGGLLLHPPGLKLPVTDLGLRSGEQEDILIEIMHNVHVLR